ncbi:MAG: 3-dehydroquinate synthase [Burkholderiaceae bacterium]
MSQTTTSASTSLSTLEVGLGARSYPIDIVDGPVNSPALHAPFWKAFLAHCGARRDLAVVTNDTLAPMFGDALCGHFADMGHRVVPIVVPDGEQFKDSRMLDAIHDAMLEAHFDRTVTVVALGGGVVGDVAGFAAATYQRGVRFVQVPTTLLAQVDSSVGGKTGINHRFGKNMIGAFHQPCGVVVDLSTLDTLPAREFAAGLAEVIKYGASLDAAFFAWLEDAMPRLLARDRDALGHAIRRCCELKAAIVGADEREAGLRALLNFGHTFGHAIEGASGYGNWLHGEAVAAGMMMATRLSVDLGLVDGALCARLAALLACAGLPIEPPELTVAEWRRWMSSDKKAEAGRLRFVLLDGLGSAHVAAVDDAVLDALLADARAGVPAAMATRA